MKGQRAKKRNLSKSPAPNTPKHPEIPANAPESGVTIATAEKKAT